MCVIVMHENMTKSNTANRIEWLALLWTRLQSFATSRRVVDIVNNTLRRFERVRIRTCLRRPDVEWSEKVCQSFSFWMAGFDWQGRSAPYWTVPVLTLTSREGCVCTRRLSSASYSLWQTAKSSGCGNQGIRGGIIPPYFSVVSTAVHRS